MKVLLRNQNSHEPLNLKKKIGVGCFLEDVSAVASVLGLILSHVLS